MGRSGARYAQLGAPANVYSNFNNFQGVQLAGLAVKHVQKTAAYAATVLDIVILCDATAGAFAITLPFAGNDRQVWIIKKTDASANAVTVTPGSGTIDSAASLALAAQNASVIVMSDGTNGWVLAKN